MNKIVSKITKFKPGDVVKHKRQGYRAVIIDIDPLFQASGRYNPQALKRGFANRQPWCRVLIDQSQQESYVEECHLILDESASNINNPKIRHYLVNHNGRLHPRYKLH